MSQSENILSQLRATIQELIQRSEVAFREYESCSTLLKESEEENATLQTEINDLHYQKANSSKQLQDCQAVLDLANRSSQQKDAVIHDLTIKLNSICEEKERLYTTVIQLLEARGQEESTQNPDIVQNEIPTVEHYSPGLDPRPEHGPDRVVGEWLSRQDLGQHLSNEAEQSGQEIEKVLNQVEEELNQESKEPKKRRKV
jgi:hypothetical protein